MSKRKSFNEQTESNEFKNGSVIGQFYHQMNYLDGLSKKLAQEKKDFLEKMENKENEIALQRKKAFKSLYELIHPPLIELHSKKSAEKSPGITTDDLNTAYKRLNNSILLLDKIEKYIS